MYIYIYIYYILPIGLPIGLPIVLSFLLAIGLPIVLPIVLPIGLPIVLPIELPTTPDQCTPVSSQAGFLFFPGNCCKHFHPCLPVSQCPQELYFRIKHNVIMFNQ